MNLLNDAETRIFLSAMSREAGVCKKLDEECPEEKNLEAVCNSIIAKVYRARPNIHAYWINKYDKEYTVQGLFYPKRVDVAVLKKGEVVGVVSFKFIWLS